MQEYYIAQRQLRAVQGDKNSVGTPSVMESIPSTPEVLTGACGDDAATNPFLRVTSQRKMSHDSGTFVEATSDCGDSDVIDVSATGGDDDVMHRHYSSDKESSTSSADTIVDQLPLASGEDGSGPTTPVVMAPSDVTPPADVTYPSLTTSSAIDPPVSACMASDAERTESSSPSTCDVSIDDTVSDVIAQTPSHNGTPTLDKTTSDTPEAEVTVL